MNRRGFLKMIGGLAALVLSPIRPNTKPVWGAAGGYAVPAEAVPSLAAGLRKEFAAIYRQTYRVNQAWTKKVIEIGIKDETLKEQYGYFEVPTLRKWGG